MNERCAPDLLPHQDELVNDVKDRINEQVNLINELDESQMLQKDLYNMELERINYMLRNYLRDRLRKITKLALYLANNADAQASLSDHEHVFVTGYVNLYQQHMDRSVWDSVDTSRIDENLKDISTTPSLVVEPKMDAHVFCKALEDLDPIATAASTDENIKLDAGDVALLRYGLVKDLVRDGRVVLT